MDWGYHAWNSSSSVNQACVTAMANKYGTPAGNVSEGWRCMFGSAVAPFIQTPLFILNSKYDSWQKKRIIGLGSTECCAPTQPNGRGCSPQISACNETQKAFWVDYGHKMLALLDAVPMR